ncbi:MAG: transketolase, partial [Candidatus Margulisiibacteriota bacterium]
ARIDGHSYEQIFDSLGRSRSRVSQKPLVVIADTVKGKGVDVMCYNPLWHGLAPSGEEAEQAKLCLERSA